MSDESEEFIAAEELKAQFPSAEETSPLDVCKCGDYRRQHKDGVGRCLLGDLCTPSGCHKFRLSHPATKDTR